MAVYLEQTIRYSPLGIRFWDPVTDAQITENLVVSAWPIEVPSRKTAASKTMSNNYAFFCLPGLRDLELSTIAPEDVSEMDRRNFIVNVHDNAGRYIDVSFDVRLPLTYQGILLSENLDSPAKSAPKGVYMYSRISRTLPRHFAVVRGQLLDQTNGNPAQFALVKVSTEEGETWFGISDRDGQFLLSLPYPSLSDGFGGSPAGGQVALHHQSWNINVEVCYAPTMQEHLVGTDIPNYVSVLGQDVAEIFPFDPDVSSTAIAQLPLVLEFNKAVVTRSEGLSELYVRPR